MTMGIFELHRQLADDTYQIGDLPLCRVLLMNDCRYPWVILVPRRAGITELHQLDRDAGWQLCEESRLLSLALVENFSIDKMNVAALGNLVPQLHLHHVGRRYDDVAWPGPVWGHSVAKPYREDELGKIRTCLQRALGISCMVD